MNVPKVISSRLVTPLLLVSLLGITAGGCKTDELAAPERDVAAGPVTSLENPPGIDLPSVPVANRSEVDLVEEMLLHRAMYARLLRALATYYTENGYHEKAVWAQTELNDLRRVKPYRYILDAEAAGAALSPTNSIAEADQLYEEAMDLMKKGGHGVPALYNQETMKRALAKLKQLVNEYPSSDKIDDAAFHVAEIHKEYFEEKDNSIAAAWYKRAIEMNPDTPYPVRFQLAVLYDYRMHEREKALHWYNEVLEEEAELEKTNTAFAKARIRQLTSEETRLVPGETVPPGEPPVKGPAPQ
jgi:tetratricopeptide (TPR) repeat protein